MPSSHTAVIIAVTYAIGIIEGFDSAVFALSLVYSFFIMHDAIKVRGESGKQALVINIIADDLEKLKRSFDESESETPDMRVKEMLGHTYTEVLGGLILGLLVTYTYFLIV